MTVLCLSGGDRAVRDALVTTLISGLSAKDIAVSVLARTHDDDPIDTPGKDTHAHSQAGARAVLAISDARWALFRGEQTPPALSELLTRMQPGGVILALGFDEAPYPTLVVDGDGIDLRRSPIAHSPRFGLDKPGSIIDFILRLNNPDR